MDNFDYLTRDWSILGIETFRALLIFTFLDFYCFLKTKNFKFKKNIDFDVISIQKVTLV